MFSGLGSTLMTGMAFGAGSEIAHQAVRGIMGSGSGKHIIFDIQWFKIKLLKFLKILGNKEEV